MLPTIPYIIHIHECSVVVQTVYYLINSDMVVINEVVHSLNYSPEKNCCLLIIIIKNFFNEVPQYSTVSNDWD